MRLDKKFMSEKPISNLNDFSGKHSLHEKK